MTNIIIAFVVVVAVFVVLWVVRRQHKFNSQKRFVQEPVEPASNEEALGGTTDDAMPKPRLLGDEPVQSTSVYQQAPEFENDGNPVIVINIFSHKGKQFAGYELLQALLAVGMRFGDMDIFHRYQKRTGKGTVMFSLACATEPGTFDIHSMGGFSCSGLTLFMALSGHSGIDGERFELMLNTAKQLAEELQGELLNARRQTLSLQEIQHYQIQIQAA